MASTTFSLSSSLEAMDAIRLINLFNRLLSSNVLITRKLNRLVAVSSGAFRNFFVLLSIISITEYFLVAQFNEFKAIILYKPDVSIASSVVMYMAFMSIQLPMIISDLKNRTMVTDLCQRVLQIDQDLVTCFPGCAQRRCQYWWIKLELVQLTCVSIVLTVRAIELSVLLSGTFGFAIVGRLLLECFMLLRLIFGQLVAEILSSQFDTLRLMAISRENLHKMVYFLDELIELKKLVSRTFGVQLLCGIGITCLTCSVLSYVLLIDIQLGAFDEDDDFWDCFNVAYNASNLLLLFLLCYRHGTVDDRVSINVFTY